MSQTRKMNRESADALKLDNDSFDPTKDMNDQEKWDQVTQRIDFNAKGELKFSSLRVEPQVTFNKYLGYSKNSSGRSDTNSLYVIRVLVNKKSD